MAIFGAPLEEGAGSSGNVSVVLEDVSELAVDIESSIKEVEEANGDYETYFLDYAKTYRGTSAISVNISAKSAISMVKDVCNRMRQTAQSLELSTENMGTNNDMSTESTTQGH